MSAMFGQAPEVYEDVIYVNYVPLSDVNDVVRAAEVQFSEDGGTA